jgi:hypothetical protein
VDIIAKEIGFTGYKCLVPRQHARRNSGISHSFGPCFQIIPLRRDYQILTPRRKDAKKIHENLAPNYLMEQVTTVTGF